MESTPLFSVLCVCWNEGAFLAEGIRSVLRQSESSLELILVDDHSTDTTWEIMSAAAKEDPRVVILRNPTKGKVAGFNAAVALSKGQWIHLLGGDDMLAPTCLEACRKVIDSSSSDLSGVYHDYTILNKETGETIETIIQGPWLTQASITQAIRKKYGIGGGFLAIRGPLARDIVWPQPVTWKSEDVALAVILKTLGEVKYVPEPLYLYRLAKSHTRYVPSLASRKCDLNHFCSGLQLFRQRSTAWNSLPAEAVAQAERHFRQAELLNKPEWSIIQALKSDLGFLGLLIALASRCDEQLYYRLVISYRRLRDLALGIRASKRG